MAERLSRGSIHLWPCAVDLHNTLTIAQEQLGRRVAHPNEKRMYQVCAALRFSLECN